MIRFLGIKVDNTSHFYRDNLGVIQNATIKDSLLSKKRIEISYHKLREAVTAIIIFLIKIALKDNFPYCLTKALLISDHNRLVNGIFYE